MVLLWSQVITMQWVLVSFTVLCSLTSKPPLPSPHTHAHSRSPTLPPLLSHSPSSNSLPPHTHTHSLPVSLPPYTDYDYEDDDTSGSYSSFHVFSIMIVLLIFAVSAYLCIHNKKTVLVYITNAIFDQDTSLFSTLYVANDSIFRML